MQTNTHLAKITGGKKKFEIDYGVAEKLLEEYNTQGDVDIHFVGSLKMKTHYPSPNHDGTKNEIITFEIGDIDFVPINNNGGQDVESTQG